MKRFFRWAGFLFLVFLALAGAGAGTLALGAAVAVLVALAVRRIARKRREGGAVSGCGGSCDGCAGCGAMPEAPVDRAFEGTPEPEEPSEASVR